MKLQSPVRTFKTAKAQCYSKDGFLYNAGFSYHGPCEFEVEDSVVAIKLTSMGSGNAEQEEHYWLKDVGWCGTEDPRVKETIEKLTAPKPEPKYTRPKLDEAKPKSKPSETYVKVEKAFKKVTDEDRPTRDKV